MGKPSFPKMILTIEVRDKNGKLIEKRKMESKTFVYNFIKLLHDAFMNVTINVLGTGGTQVSFANSTGIGSIFAINAGSGTDTYGILVGSGTKSYDPFDYQLQNKIPNNTLNYSAVNIDVGVANVGTATPPYLYFNITRTFTNNTTASVTVSEVGLAINGNNNPVLIARDVLSSAITVPGSGTLTITYSIQLVYG